MLNNCEKLKYCLFHSLPPGIELLGLEWSNYMSFMQDILMTRVRVELLAQGYPDIEIKYPANWFEHCKSCFLPQILKRFFPVKYEVKVIKFKILYPYAIGKPKEFATINVEESRREEFIK